MQTDTTVTTMPKKTAAAPPRLPNFLIIGTAKAATTSLYHYLRQHPQVFMPAKKEMHFFSSLPSDEGTYVTNPPVNPSDPHRHIVDLDDYLSLFRDAGNRKAVGEASPTYIYYTASAHNIHKMIPQAKLIAILRNPADRAFSAWVHLVRDGAEELSFEEALEQEPERIRQGMPAFYHLKAWGYYYQQLKHYYDLFDREQIRIYLQEEVNDHPHGVIADVFRFLGVDDSFRPDMAVRHNVSGMPKNLKLHRFLTEGIHRHWFFNIVKRPIPERLYRKWLTYFKNRNLVKPEINPTTRAKLLQEYREDIQACQELIGKNLGHWLE